MARLDPHSYNDDSQPEVRAVSWKARVDFSRRVIDAEARLEFARPGIGPLDLDTRGLAIHAVNDQAGRTLPWKLEAEEGFLGQRLRLELPPATVAVTIRYSTSPDASALQWLTPEQTAGKKHPFLFSQCQAIHARSVLPCQDTPRVRITYEAEVTAPRALRVVMGAGHLARREHGELATETFSMPQAIPPYLFALAVGELSSKELGARSRVWAEPSVVDRAADEFSGVDAMLQAAEELFGPYDWDRFDILCMPPSFPYGGMENPRLTFVTPSLLAGDKSLVSVVAHELAHSWTGNLVTNTNAEHFWLNEGFTVFAERRIVEAIWGTEIASLQAALGRKALEESVKRFEDKPELTKLRTELSGIDPDDAFSSVPYEKGYLFLRALEETVGRERWNAFVRRYISTFRFTSITTEDFLAFVKKELPGSLEKANADAFVNAPGIPASAPSLKSARLEKVQSLSGKTLEVADTDGWTPNEWQLYLESLPHPQPEETLRALDARFHLTDSKNYEVLTAWLTLAARSGYVPTLERTEAVLSEIGRMKYLRPLYQALAARPATKARAKALFERVKGGYHPIAQQVVAGILEK